MSDLRGQQGIPTPNTLMGYSYHQSDLGQPPVGIWRSSIEASAIEIFTSGKGVPLETTQAAALGVKTRATV